ncbi:DUF3488 and transglutaminase-like domain-containing protein [bacterium]|nr:DUF3488 and transglutaminase-like domain-containing protein [bacterium]
MIISWKIPRHCLVWLLLSQLGIVLMHVANLPVWIFVLFLGCSTWRWLTFQGRFLPPTKAIKTLFVFSLSYLVYVEFGSLLGVESTVVLLLTALCLKLLETHTKRDVYVAIYLAYFSLATVFLFEQGILYAILVFILVIIITTALLTLHQSCGVVSIVQSVKKTLIMSAQALPIMVVVFVVFPRFEPLWKMPSRSSNAQVGMTGSISPGDITNLGSDGRLAFRADFQENVPPLNSLYWRGVVLSEFDGRTWYQGDWKYKAAIDGSYDVIPIDKSIATESITYTIMQEPTYQSWLFSLATAYSQDDHVKSLADYRLVYHGIANKRIKYHVVSYLDVIRDLELSSEVYELETQLPQTGNKKARAFARRVFEANEENPRQYISSLFKHFNIQNYVYTLKPPLLGDDSVDEFLFDTRRGFCSHYASSFAFLMREVGIPARVIGGYQGGEINPLTGSVLVHQFDAHAWVEVWLEGEGWVRFDPTSAVSPDRIEYGLERAMSEVDGFLEGDGLSAVRYRNISWINDLRLRWDAVDYYWSSWILQYRGDKQSDFMRRFLGNITPITIGVFTMGSIGLVLIFVAFDLLKIVRRVKVLPENKIYRDICRLLQKRNIAISDGVPLGVVCDSLNDEGDRVFLELVVKDIDRLMYEPLSDVMKEKIRMRLKQRFIAFKRHYSKKKY